MMVAHMDLNKAEAIMQEEFNKILRWTHDRGLVINSKKTKLMHIRTPKQTTREIKIKFHSCNCLEKQHNNQLCTCDTFIENVECVKYLGVHIDSHLKWNVHIEELRKKLRSCSFKLYQLRPYLPFKTLKTVYAAIAESLIRYGIQVWGNSADTYIQTIMNIQKTILKNMIPVNIQVLREHIFIYCDILSVKGLYKSKIIIQNYFSDQYKQYQTHNYRTRIKESEYCVVPSYVNNYGKRLLKVTVPSLFNAMPVNLRNLIFMSELKCCVKKWVITLD